MSLRTTPRNNENIGSALGAHASPRAGFPEGAPYRRPARGDACAPRALPMFSLFLGVVRNDMNNSSVNQFSVFSFQLVRITTEN